MSFYSTAMCDLHVTCYVVETFYSKIPFLPSKCTRNVVGPFTKDLKINCFKKRKNKIIIIISFKIFEKETEHIFEYRVRFGRLKRHFGEKFSSMTPPQKKVPIVPAIGTFGTIGTFLYICKIFSRLKNVNTLLFRDTLQSAYIYAYTRLLGRFATKNFVECIKKFGGFSKC